MMKKGKPQADSAALEQAWRRGRPAADVKRSRPTTSVVSIRLPSDVVAALSRRAKAEGKPASVLARDLIERGLAVEGPMTPPDLARTFTKWVEETGSM